MPAEDPSRYQYTVNDCMLNFVCLFAFQDEESFDKCVNETTFPIIICSGVTLGAGSSMVNALGLLISVYYVFDIAYPAKASNVYFFVKC